MALNIKNKIRLGTLFLFLLLVLSGGLSLYYLIKLKNDTSNIIKDNYETLEYGHDMQKQLDSIHLHVRTSAAAISRFDGALKKQEENITEPGEREATGQLRLAFNKLLRGDSTESSYDQIRENIRTVLQVNMKAIERKNGIAQRSAASITSALVIILVLTFIVGLSFSFNFPGVLVAPIQKLTEATNEIGKKNYKHRIHFDNKDEFGQLADAFNAMTMRLEEFENSNLSKLIFEKTRAEAVINSLKDASIGIDKNNLVLFANQRALQLLALKAEDVLGQSATAVGTKNDLFRFLLTKENGNPFKIVLDNKENYYVKELIEVSPGDTGNRVIVLKNITSFKELDVAKTNFIATVSHELKTPLASADLGLKLLEDPRIGELSAEQQELVRQLKNDNQRMLKILSELLNMSQVEAGKIQLNIQTVSPYQVIEDSIRAVSSAARAKGVRLDKQPEPGLPDIQADPDKISWVLNNFLTNAIRYAPDEGNIVIAAAARAGQISFSVTDQGPGIEEQYVNRIFERYFQVPGRSDKKGSGIGLAICKEFIEAMGGRTWVKSQLGAGSTFGFDLRI